VNLIKGQHLGTSKFTSDAHKEAYIKIKALKTILNIDLNNYFLKKLLLRPVDFNTKAVSYQFLYEVMHQPELKEKFESRVNYEEWARSINIPLKKKKEDAK
jgi:predicted transcriptional regulator